MNETMLRIKTAIVAALSGVCLLLGWRGNDLQMLFCSVNSPCIFNIKKEVY